MTTHGYAHILRTTTHHTYTRIYRTLLRADEPRQGSIWHTYIIAPLGNWPKSQQRGLLFLFWVIGKAGVGSITFGARCQHARKAAID